MQNFRQLKVWGRAHAFALEIRRVAGTFPSSGYTELKSQLIRAAESIPTNIVEGCGAATRKEFARFIDISIKSTSEVEYQLQLARDNEILSASTWQTLSKEVVEIRMMLCGLRRALLGSNDTPPPRERRKKPYQSGAD
jgi:four helix bundle protein